MPALKSPKKLKPVRKASKALKKVGKTLAKATKIHGKALKKLSTAAKKTSAYKPKKLSAKKHAQIITSARAKTTRALHKALAALDEG